MVWKKNTFKFEIQKHLPSTKANRKAVFSSWKFLDLDTVVFSLLFGY